MTGEVNEASLRKKLASGVETAEGTHVGTLGASRVIQTLAPDTAARSEVTVGVKEGKHRMVRKEGREQAAAVVQFL